jgi:hypothetical protein
VVFCEAPRPYVLVEVLEERPYITSFLNPPDDQHHVVHLTPGIGAYTVDAEKRAERPLYTER